MEHIIRHNKSRLVETCRSKNTQIKQNSGVMYSYLLYVEDSIVS